MLRRLVTLPFRLRTLAAAAADPSVTGVHPSSLFPPRRCCFLDSLGLRYLSTAGNGGRSGPFRPEAGGGERDVFDEIDKAFSRDRAPGVGASLGDWDGVDEPWKLGNGQQPEEDDVLSDVFGPAGVAGEQPAMEEMAGGVDEERSSEEDSRTRREQLEIREKELKAILKGPNRAFGDLVAASGITEDMIDSLILLKNVEGKSVLPPLREIEEKAIARMNKTSSRAEVERKKQEEIAQARVRKVDEYGRAYGTGRRKCSVARVWIQQGDGKFTVNEKQFDVYFPVLDDRATLLRPFTVTKTLGLWDVKCTVKGGGVSGQVGAIRLGISRALQNWEPGYRPYLKAAGYLTRDSRVVERKKPGKAKARKSFQWAKR